MSARVALLLALALPLLLAAPHAYARSVEEKPAGPTVAERTAHNQRLRALVGKPAVEPISVQHLHTHEWTVIDPAKGATLPQDTLDELLRCHQTNQRTRIDARLVTAIVAAALEFNKRRVLVVSGFRAPKFNLALRKKGREVARDSQHTHGTAVDFKLPGVAPKRLLAYVRRLRLGGVGFYPESGFVHCDTGPIRSWTGR